MSNINNIGEDEVKLIFTALLTSGSYEGKVSALVMESLAIKVEQTDPTGFGTMSSREVADWLRGCRDAVLEL